VPIEGIQPLLNIMRANLGHLNELRTQVLNSGQRATTGRVARRVRHERGDHSR
jgi:hypothetical protein